MPSQTVRPRGSQVARPHSSTRFFPTAVQLSLTVRQCHLNEYSEDGGRRCPVCPTGAGPRAPKAFFFAPDLVLCVGGPAVKGSVDQQPAVSQYAAVNPSSRNACVMCVQASTIQTPKALSARWGQRGLGRAQMRRCGHRCCWDWVSAFSLQASCSARATANSTTQPLTLNPLHSQRCPRHATCTGTNTSTDAPNPIIVPQVEAHPVASCAHSRAFLISPLQFHKHPALHLGMPAAKPHLHVSTVPWERSLTYGAGWVVLNWCGGPMCRTTSGTPTRSLSR